MKHTLIYALCVWLSGITSVSCVEDVYAEYPPEEQVLLIYLAADNQLPSDSIQTIVNAIVAGCSTSSNQHIFVSYSKGNGGMVLAKVVCENEKMGLQPINNPLLNYSIPQPTMLSRVVEIVHQYYPMQKHNLVLRTSTTGWISDRIRQNPKLAPTEDDKQQTLQALCAEIPDGMLSTITFETNFSASIEAIYPLRKKADYLFVTSTERIEPGYTPLFQTHIYSLCLGNQEQFGRVACQYYSTRIGELNQAATYSIICTRYLERLADFVASHCRPVAINEVAAGNHQYYDRTDAHLYYDFGEYYGGLLASDEERSQLDDLLKQCVVWKRDIGHFQLLDDGYNIINHSGLTTYILQLNFKTLNQSFSDSEWGQRFEANQSL